jgi:hypothetical protein
MHTDVVNAMFRRVPGRVEAENYGHDGPNQSYFVKDASLRSKLYRVSEPVIVEPIEGGERGGSQQGLRLGEGEWTAYVIRSLTARDYAAVLRAKAEGGTAVVEVSLGGRTQDVTVSQGDWTEIPLAALSLSQGDWTEIPLAALSLSQGDNRLKILAKSGTACLDWISLK